ncbi:MAG: ATP-binding cassette domain-containing protein, partial [Rhodospirillaceae bacterium]|nr:ATP-binding cassette domain-containing protein [Rhodospirillaceae bacterium]
MMTDAPLLSVENLSVTFGDAAPRVVDGVSFSLRRGETLALVGESGSGKSVTALSILRLLPTPLARHPSGRITFDGADVLSMPTVDLQGLRGGRIGMVFQEPMTSLNPLHGIGRQVGETLALHAGLSGSALHTRVVELLTLVGLPN